MRGLENEHKQSMNLTLNDGDDVGGGEGARGGRPLANRFGRPGPPPPPISSRRSVMMWRLEV